MIDTTGQARPLAPQARGGLLWAPWFRVLSMCCMNSGHLLPLTADGAGLNLLHIFAHSQRGCVGCTRVNRLNTESRRWSDLRAGWNGRRNHLFD
jgi:hypothetical protein